MSAKIRYKQKAIIVVSETTEESGKLPLIHGVFMSPLDALEELREAKTRPAHLCKNIRQIPVEFEFYV